MKKSASPKPNALAQEYPGLLHGYSPRQLMVEEHPGKGEEPDYIQFRTIETHGVRALHGLSFDWLHCNHRKALSGSWDLSLLAN
jgi:hypothetical protein